MKSGAVHPALVVLLGLLPLTAACGISVDKDDNGRNKNVSISTPLGKLQVKADADTPPDTGLAVHGGARAIRDEEHENANVNIEGGFFGVKVAVARYEDQAERQVILDYYRKELARFGTVTECRGNLDFKDSRAAPRGNATEFTLIHVQTRS